MQISYSWAVFRALSWVGIPANLAALLHLRCLGYYKLIMQSVNEKCHMMTFATGN